jgi:DNA-binding NarL/FixJ family response regulator
VSAKANRDFLAHGPPATSPAFTTGSGSAPLAIDLSLDLVVGEFAPLAAAFFGVGPDGEVRTTYLHGPTVPVSIRKAVLRGVDRRALDHLASPRPLIALAADASREGRALNDLWLPIHDGEELVAGIALWRAWDSPAWTGRQLRVLAALQPLIEMAYVSALRDASSIDALLPPTLTRRQRQVARMLAAGATNPEVARALSISADTAKSHTRAVLIKLGVASRRELVMTVARQRAGDASGPGQGDEAAELMLTMVLDWAAKRGGAIVGGCALLSARAEPIAEAWATAPVGARHLDPAVVRRAHSEIVRRAVEDRPRSPVLRVDPGAGKAEDRLRTLLAELGIAPPLLAVLRRQGRVAGLIWLTEDARGGVDPRENAQALRSVHPLLELAYATPMELAQAPVSSFADIAGRGLTARELSVARLALDGRSNAEIAATLGISKSTVKHHMGRVLAKCGLRSRTQLLALVTDA